MTAKQRDIEQVIAAIAARQHGIVTRGQLLRAGASPDVLDRRVKAGRLQRIHKGVYLVGPIEAPFAREMAAVLACGTGAALSHESAAALWGILPVRRAARSQSPDRAVSIVHVSVAADRRVHRPGIRVHRPSTLQTDEVTIREAIPVTSAARTLHDLAGCTSHRDLERALAEAFALRLTSQSEVCSLVAGHAGRPGARRLRDLLGAASGPALTRSEAEERFLALIRKAQLPNPELNIEIEKYEIDFFWRAERLVVEIDGRAFHSSDRSFENDRRRDAVLLAAGLRVMRVTWRQIVKEPEAVLVRLTRALAVPLHFGTAPLMRRRRENHRPSRQGDRSGQP